ncbi:MAG: SDR family NAD(P)-dependent oxidoreductase, partial [Actinomycetota bacterium]|nr:SDR family NAD(P)-dependent oxidoreductase [Actinomycetota bacterium]
MDTEQRLRDYLKRAGADLQKTRQRLAEVETAAHEPIAVIGMSCRYPGGVTGPEDLWEMVAAGRDGVTGLPADRGWYLDALTDATTLSGGFLHDATTFDADFFGISPREALAMDPQQRVLLEAAWEAVERSGLDPATIKGSPTGVFVGAIPQDYRPGPGDDTDGFALTGSTSSVLSGRVAYVLGLVGPAVTVDTACSSSLVSMHLAARALRAGECSLALAGGVTVMPNPLTIVEFSKQGGLAADGYCRAFADDATGTGWAEGVGVLMLERLSDAQRNGREILAVVRGTAVNSDGASNGLTAPSGPSQQRVIEQALVDARLAAGQIDVIEAHGTGTRLGDPVEAEALLATYGRAHAAGRPAYLGSVKSNLSHTQAAAGVAGVIKMIMAMRHGVLPRTLHVNTPTTHVDWSAGNLALLTANLDWPETGEPRRAAVSSFGLSGTNAHAIIEQAPPAPAASPASSALQAEAARPASAEGSGPVPLLLSARSADALAAQAGRLRGALDNPAGTLTDIAFSLATTRSKFEHRAAFVAGDLEAARAALTGPPITGVARRRAKLAVLFAGQGAQRLGAGRELAARFPAFAAALGAAIDALDPHLDGPLRNVLWGDDADLLARTEYAQPALFAVETALYRLIQSWGITPDVVAGHSVGEITAAHVAGVLSLPDAAALVAARGRLMQALPAGGAMVSVDATEDDVRPLLGDGVALAAVNGPGSVVLSGDEEAVLAAAADLAERGHRTRRLRVSHAFHSPRMDPILDDFRAVVSGLTLREPALPVVSTRTGAAAGAAELTSPGHWTGHVRDTVRFATAVATIRATGVGAFLELGPDSTLSTLVADDAVPALRPGTDEITSITGAAATLHTRGVPVDWAAWFAGSGARVVPVPTYPFQRRRFWPREGFNALGDLRAAGLGAAGHPLLSAVVSLAGDGGVLLTGRLSAATQPWLTGHRVGGTAVLPGAALVELAVRAGDEVGCDLIGELTLAAPLLLGDAGDTQVQLWIGAPGEDGQRPLSIHSRPDDGDDTPWTRHATGSLGAAPDTPAAVLTAWPPAGAEPLDLAGFYDALAEDGLDYGPPFRGLVAAWKHDGAVYAEIAPEADLADAGAYHLHPALLDAALHAAHLAGLDDSVRGGLPFAWSGVRLHAVGATALRVRLAPGGDRIALDLADAAGAPVATVDSLLLRAAGTAEATASTARDLYRLGWVPVTGSVAETGVVRVLGADDLGLAALLGGPPAADRDALAAGTLPAVVLCPLGVPSEAAADPATTARAHLASALEIVQGLLGDDRFPDTRFVLVTRGATGDAPDPAAASVWGLLRAAQAEHPGRFGLLDLDPRDPGTEQAVRAALGLDEPQLAVREGVPHAARLTRLTPPALADGPDLGDGTVVVTGGTGGLGAVIARHLAVTGRARHLLLLSRRGAGAPGVDELLAAVTATGATATVVACDAADRVALAEALTAVPADRPITAVVHAAGVLSDGVVTTLTPEKLAAVLAPKVDAAANLAALTADRPLSAFVLFSSAAGLLGAPGQGNYAAANAFLDAFATGLRARGVPAVSLAWGPWAEGTGMADERAGARMRMRGTPPLAVAHGLALFDAALGAGEPVVAPLRLDLAALRSAPVVPPVLRALVNGAGRRTAVNSTATGLAATLSPLDPATRHDTVLGLVREQIGAVLGHAGARGIDPDRPLADLGFDSLTAVELRNRLSVATGLRLAPTLAFDHPTPAALAAHVLDLTLGSDPAAADVPARVRDDDPIVVVGMACRYPGGVASPDDLWRLVRDGRDAITGFPVNRGWDLDRLYHPDPGHPGTSYTLNGGFLHDAGDFDPAFFGMSPREAVAADAQQRLLLETAWEALERSGLDPRTLRGSRTGVFTGIMYGDYGAVLSGEEYEGFVGTGSSGSVASGRVAYTLGLEGPAVTVDTACSSSLVAMHWAMQALRAGECGLALAGGATVMSTPAAFVEFSRQRGLSPEGRCKAYGEDADGVAWAEGAGLVVLERQSDALRNGHPILAVVRGSAVNSDGASNGLTAPNGGAQQQVIRQALAAAGLAAADVDVIEGHGTGTALGDPIEAQALLATYGQERETPVLLGSVKSNLGHTQAAAGVAGVIKMIEAMRHGVVPRTLHAGTPSSRVDWEAGRVELLTAERGWPAPGRPRRAAVSSFGFSGTNAHLILEQPEPAAEPVGAVPPAEVPPAELPAAGPVPVLLSARSTGALRDQATRLIPVLDDAERTGSLLTDLAHSLALSRTAFEHRAAVVTADPVVLRRALAALAAGDTDPALHTDEIAPGRRLAMLFTGQGSQRPGMGRELAARHPVFAGALDEVLTHLPQGLRDRMWSDDEDALTGTEHAQAALFAVEVALFRLLASLGVRPAALAGHSIGEIAAAHIAGVLSLADACTLVTARGQLMQALPPGGAMVAVEAAEAEAVPHLTGTVAIAAVNGPRSIVLSGAEEPVLALAARFAADGRRTRRLAVSHAFHSPLMDPMLDDFRAVAETLTHRPPVIPLVSALTGAPLTEVTADHWVEHVRRPVRFADALAALEADTFAEVGPDAVLSALAPEGAAVPLQRHGRDENATLTTGLARLHGRGVAVDWAAFLAPLGGRRIDLPTYPFQHEHYWPQARPRTAADTSDDGLWAAVDDGDADALAATLGLGDGERDSLRTVLPALTSWRRNRHDRTRRDALRYRIAWTRLADPGPAQLTGTWLLAGPDPQDRLATMLHRHGAAVHAVTAGQITAGELPDGDIAGVLSTLGADERPGPALTIGLTATHDLLLALAARGTPTRLWTVTAATTDHPLQAAVWGYGRTAALEFPRLWGGLAELPGDADDATLDRFAALLARPGGEDQVAVRPDGVYGRRLTRHPRLAAAPAPTAAAPAPTAAVLVTGGTGGLGAAIARHLAAGGVTRLILTSRRGADAPGAAGLAAELTALGAEAEIAACDVADRTQVAALLARIGDLGGVVHAAGTAPVRPLAETTADDLAEALAAKALGAAHLDELLGDRSLGMFVLIGSIAGVVGSGAQAGYAAANAYLDALAANRRARGLAATSIGYGPWRDSGLAAGARESHELARRGLVPLPSDIALAELTAAVAAADATVTLVDVDWARYLPIFSAARPSSLLGDLPEARAAAAAPQRTGTAAELAAKLADLDEAGQLRQLTALVRTEAAAVLGHERPEAVADRKAFRDLGFDSLTAVELRTRLGVLTGLTLPTTMVFDHPTPARLAAYLRGELLGATAGVTAATRVAADHDDPIVVIGMSCRYPGGAGSPEQLWQLVADGVDAISGFPGDRGWEGQLLVDADPDRAGATYCTQGGFLAGADRFDAGFFGISPREALAMDPQQRLLLEAAWEAFERAGVDPAELRGTATGTFIGGSGAEYGGRADGDGQGHVVTGTIPSVLSGRLAYVFGLEGPAVTVDTACSSSLVALHLAVQSVRSGESSLAIAGGVTVMTTPAPFVAFSRQRALAADGRSKAFGAGADGMALAEGVGIVLVERLSDALRHGHDVLAVIKGSAINSDGASNGLTAPNGLSQQRVIRQALANAHLSPADVDAVEAHGTGTALGDPIEARALQETYGRDRDPQRPLWLGSVKSNIGHSQSAAGVAGVIKMIEAMRHATLPPTLHAAEPSGHVDWSAGTVRLIAEAQPWAADGRPRRSAVSSFGISGTNAHVILEEAPPAEEAPSAPAVRMPVPLVLSARDDSALRARADDLIPLLGPDTLADLGHSLVTTRANLEQRAVAIGHTGELAAALEELATGRPGPAVVTGSAGLGGRTVFVFPGQGAQWVGMGARLLDESPVFAARMAECGAALA